LQSKDFVDLDFAELVGFTWKLFIEFVFWKEGSHSHLCEKNILPGPNVHFSFKNISPLDSEILFTSMHVQAKRLYILCRI